MKSIETDSGRVQEVSSERGLERGPDLYSALAWGNLESLPAGLEARTRGKDSLVDQMLGNELLGICRILLCWVSCLPRYAI